MAQKWSVRWGGGCGGARLDPWVFLGWGMCAGGGNDFLWLFWDQAGSLRDEPGQAGCPHPSQDPREPQNSSLKSTSLKHKSAR